MDKVTAPSGAVVEGGIGGCYWCSDNPPAVVGGNRCMCTESCGYPNCAAAEKEPSDPFSYRTC